jgi:hypothetical protein
MHSIFLSSKSRSLIEFLQTLLRVSKDFQKIFIDMYLSKYQFLIDPAIIDKADL